MRRYNRPPLRLILGLAACLLSFSPGSPSPASQPAGKGDRTEKSDAPQIRLRAASAGADHWELTFEASNPGESPIPYSGYLANSFDPPLKDGTISPLYRVGLRSGGKWAEKPMGWCGTGRGPVSLPPKGKATFTAVVPKGGWDGLKVGLTWWPSPYRKVSAEVAWSDPLTPEDLEKRAKP
jgi:hypothetical protein